MPSKKRPTRPAPKVPTPPREPRPPKVEQPAAQPDHLRIVQSNVADQTGEIFVGLAEAPAKPSEETEAVLTALMLTNEASWEAAGVPRASPLLLQRFAADIVRRFPGLTHKPRLPRAAHEDQQQAKRGRLPDGSIFLAVWRADDAEGDGQWEGVLVTDSRPGLAEMLDRMIVAAGAHFRLRSAGVFGVLKGLDNLYRTWLGRQKGGGK